VEQLVESGLFELVINTFFRSSEAIQNIILRKILNLTKGLLVNQENASDLIGKVILILVIGYHLQNSRVGKFDYLIQPDHRLAGNFARNSEIFQ